ncbi:hypothetical protein CIB84_007662 [Bambusicola thoracicus]|uniref:Uncharacterized protein n=1 Tax=Bambusicola thoracicus TaxID=9083 RepID=A0A2P4SWU1_BAMTH|nr:hypothetical protein CIB84_007662 [Bambusicola thoracicus]
MKFIVWRRFKWLFIGLIILLIILLFVAVLLYSLPVRMVKCHCCSAVGQASFYRSREQHTLCTSDKRFYCLNSSRDKDYKVNSYKQLQLTFNEK